MAIAAIAEISSVRAARLKGPGQNSAQVEAGRNTLRTRLNRVCASYTKHGRQKMPLPAPQPSGALADPPSPGKIAVRAPERPGRARSRRFLSPFGAGEKVALCATPSAPEGGKRCAARISPASKGGSSSLTVADLFRGERLAL